MLDRADSPGLLTFRFVIGSRLVTVAIPRYSIGVCLLVGLIGYALGTLHSGADHRRQSEMLAVLKERNSQLERSLSQKEQERDQMVALAETRSEELWGELEDRDRELARLWSIVGQHSEPSTRPWQTLSSRGGGRPVGDVKTRYSQLQSKLQENNERMRELSVATQMYNREQRALMARKTPSLAPCRGEMTSGYGNRLHPVYGYSRLHSGCDFTSDYGTPIHATADGTVLSSDWLGGYGKTVEIDHGRGLKTLYAHCDTLKVKKGQKIRKGQAIATVGTTGLSSGPHCHYEVHHNGKAVDPAPYLPRGFRTRAKS